MSKDEALTIVRQMVKDGKLSKEVAEEYFTELVESKDEKIRKGLITFFQRFPYDNFEKAGITIKEALTWLEKQGEQKPISITDEWIEDYWRNEKVNNPYSYDEGEEIQFDHQGFVSFCKKYCNYVS